MTARWALLFTFTAQAGHTALMFAADKGEVAAVNALMDKGANANAQSNVGMFKAFMYCDKLPAPAGHIERKHCLNVCIEERACGDNRGPSETRG